MNPKRSSRANEGEARRRTHRTSRLVARLRGHRQGARVDLARAWEALAATAPDAGGAEPPARRAAALWQAMGVRAVAMPTGD